MNLLIRYFLIVIILSVSAFAQKNVYIGAIEEEIDLGLAPYVKRVVSEAEKSNADAIIFKINTFGGRVDAATQIKDAIISTDILTIAFINNRAISAGALIALSCNKITMAPARTITEKNPANIFIEMENLISFILFVFRRRISYAKDLDSR